jgi:hypothetical protein
VSHGPHLTIEDEAKILRLAAAGLRPGEICAEVDKCRNTVWEVLSGLRQDKRAKKKQRRSLRTPSGLSLRTNHGLNVPTSMEVGSMTTAARNIFISKIVENFRSGRRPTEAMLSALERELIADGYTAAELDRAAREMLRTRRKAGFPLISECLEACIAARADLQAATADGTGTASGDGSDSAPESGTGSPGAWSRPGLGDGESVAMAPPKSARAA